MTRSLTLAMAALFIGTALAGCTGNTNNPGGNTSTTPGGASGAPQAVVTASPLAPDVGQTVTFTAAQAASSDQASWQFGDGATGTGVSTTHAYSSPGQYIVLLTVTRGSQNATNDAALTYITVTAPPLDIANITNDTPPLVTVAFSGQVVQTGSSLSFNATGSGAYEPNPKFDPTAASTPSTNPPFKPSGTLTYAWDFGDGQTATGVAANHTFNAAGLYAVKLTGTGTNGKSSTYVVTVRVLPQAPSTPGVRNPTTFLEASISEAESLDPGYDYETAGGQVIQQVYETLYYYNRDHADNLTPRLAADYPAVSADGTTYTIPLRQDVKFHDGATMTATDVKFSLDRTILMNDPDGPAWILGTIAGASDYSGSKGTAADRQTYLAAGGVTVVDDHTVKIKLSQPDPAFLFKLAFTEASIVEKAGVCAHKGNDFTSDCLPAPGNTRDPWMDRNEVGTGPFQLDAWIPGNEIILKRFDGYVSPGPVFPKPTLEKVILQHVDDINTRELMLFSGEADDVYLPVDHDVDVVNKAGLHIIENPSFTINFIGFNQQFCGGPSASNYQSCLTANSQSAPKGANGQVDPGFFSDVHMRKAWSYAFNYDSYFKDIARNHGLMANGAIPKGMFGYDGSIPAPAQDMTKAVQELKASNHSDGFSITLFYNTGNTGREKGATLLAQNVQQMCQQANAQCTVDVQGLDFSTAFLPKQREKSLPIFFLGWAPDYAFPDDYTVTFLDPVNGVYAKRVGYDDPAVKTLQDNLLKETDTSKLQKGYSDLVKMSNADFPYIWLTQAANYHVERDWVHGYYFNPMHAGGPNIGDFSTISKS
jgi:peptide/nickel transport system substrate-binding protein